MKLLSPGFTHPFMVTLLEFSIHRYFVGRPDLAIENLAVNLLFNVYPIMHHRNTRLRNSQAARTQDSLSDETSLQANLNC